MISQHILIKDSPFQSSQKIPAFHFLTVLFLNCSPATFSSLFQFFHTNTDVSLPNTIWNLIPFFVLFDCVGILLLGDNQWERQPSPLGWGNWVLLGTDEWVPILLPTPIFLWVDGNMEIDSWAFPSNSSGDALPVVGSKQGQTDMLSHKSVSAMSSMLKVVYTQRNNMSVEPRVKCGTTGWLIWGPSLCVYS